jgi:hypothetical protein
MGSKSGRSHVVRFYGMLKNSWSPTRMDRLNYHFLRPSHRSRDVSGDGQSALVDKLGLTPRRSRLLVHIAITWDSSIGPRPQCWDGSLTPSQQPVYNLQCAARGCELVVFIQTEQYSGDESTLLHINPHARRVNVGERRDVWNVEQWSYEDMVFMGKTGNIGQ